MMTSISVELKRSRGRRVPRLLLIFFNGRASCARDNYSEVYEVYL